MDETKVKVSHNLELWGVIDHKSYRLSDAELEQKEEDRWQKMGK